MTEHLYLVALEWGGLMEDPQVKYGDMEIIASSSDKEAVKIYNVKHKCNFFYGRCLGEVIDGEVHIPVDHIVGRMLRGWRND